MAKRRSILLLGVIVAVAAAAGADTRVVQQTHQDGFSVMGREQPASDQEQVLWIGSDRMRMDQGSSSVIVRLDLKKMYILNHDAQEANELDLPIDLNALLPPGMGEQMMQMMKFEAEVKATGETKRIGEWNCTGYTVSMKSPMVTIESTYWASSDVDFDLERFRSLYKEMVALQPGMSEVMDEFAKIDGFVIEQESVTKMAKIGDTTVGMNQKTISIDEVDAAAGSYDKPTNYTDKPFDFMEMAQRRQQR